MMRIITYVIAAIQIVLAWRFFRQVWATLGGERIPASGETPDVGSVSVIVPVLNEAERLAPCLESLVDQGDEVGEIIIADGGSTDGTTSLVERFAERDSRIRIERAHPVADDWNGKAWGLQAGLQSVSLFAEWVVTIDADVRLANNAVASAVSFARRANVPFLSVATRQRADTPGLAFVHPSLLSTLVYRFGIPGKTAKRLDDVQANGQFAVYDRKSLVRAGGLKIAQNSICEDVTLARHLFLSGYEVGFYESEAESETAMYADGLECLRNWPRSLSLRDRFMPDAGLRGLMNLAFLQVLPLITVIWVPRSVRAQTAFMRVNRFLFGARLGVLIGMRRAYSRRRWTYWLSPLCDPISLIAYVSSLLKREHHWRGRQLVGHDD
jgi:dolichol-phosphate mannosyltransferase